MSRVHLLRGMAAGMLAGAAAAWAMHQFTNVRPIQSPPGGSRPANEPEEHLHQSETNLDANATVQTAQRISKKVLNRELTEQEKKIAGPAVHYAYGSVVGALYGGLAELLPITAAGLGMPFGFALWLLGDEIAVPALGLSKASTEYGPEAHADALAAHFAYGVTTDVLRRVLRHKL